MEMSILALVPAFDKTFHCNQFYNGQPVFDLHEDGGAVLVELVLGDIRLQLSLFLLWLTKMVCHLDFFSFLALFFFSLLSRLILLLIGLFRVRRLLDGTELRRLYIGFGFHQCFLKGSNPFSDQVELKVDPSFRPLKKSV